jgi:hypothetical protein
MGQKQSSPKKDVAICFVFFNPARSKRILMNYLYTVNRLREFPCFTIELTFEDSKPEIPNAFHVQSDSYMFHKERMCRVLETKLPKKFKKIVFMDADLFYVGTDWYYDMSKALDTYQVVQGFEQCHWLDLTYKNIMLSRPCAVLSDTKEYSHEYHPGFVWGFQRNWYTKVGFFDWCVSGSGDTLSVVAWMNHTMNKWFASLPSSMKKAFEDFNRKPKPTISYLKDTHIFHLYHGSRQNRKYVDRHRPFNISRDIRDILTMNQDGMFEWKDRLQWNPFFMDYFNGRDDDGVELFEDESALIKTKTNHLNS